MDGRKDRPQALQRLGAPRWLGTPPDASRCDARPVRDSALCACASPRPATRAATQTPMLGVRALRSRTPGGSRCSTPPAGGRSTPKTRATTPLSWGVAALPGDGSDAASLESGAGAGGSGSKDRAVRVAVRWAPQTWRLPCCWHGPLQRCWLRTEPRPLTRAKVVLQLYCPDMQASAPTEGDVGPRPQGPRGAGPGYQQRDCGRQRQPAAAGAHVPD